MNLLKFQFFIFFLVSLFFVFTTDIYAQISNYTKIENAPSGCSGRKWNLKDRDEWKCDGNTIIRTVYSVCLNPANNFTCIDQKINEDCTKYNTLATCKKYDNPTSLDIGGPQCAGCFVPNNITPTPTPDTKPLCPTDRSDYSLGTTCSWESNQYKGSGNQKCCYDPYTKAEPEKSPTPASNPPGSGGNNPPQNPTPTIPSEVGYCGDSVPTISTMRPVNSPQCAKTSATRLNRKPSTGFETDSYCQYISNGQQPYIYQCPSTATTPIPTATPTPYTPQPVGGNCNPLQGTWQCTGGSYCSQACTSSSASCTVGKCCTYGTSWNGTTCVADPTPTQSPIATTPPATPTPITIDACPDVNPGTNPPIFYVCRPSSTGCIEGEIAKTSQAAHDTCSNFYGGSYLCCQRPPQSEAAGSSCNLNPRTCTTGSNSSNGTNIQCTGCGGYCVPTASGSSEGRCMNQYY